MFILEFYSTLNKKNRIKLNYQKSKEENNE